MISINGLVKKYGQKVAVNHLNLEIAPGEFFAFLGPNGAGKTTTIKILTGLLKPTNGTVKVCGFDMQVNQMEAKKMISYVPDQPYLYDKLTGNEFLHFIGEMYGLSSNQIKEEAKKLIEYFEMTEYIDLLSEDYSHGMKQRVVIASALMHHPKVLVIDEPMVGLDPKSSRLVKDILKKETENGMTVFMSTHTLSVAEETADRIGIIDHGQLIELGTLQELRSRSEGPHGLEDIFLTLTENELG